jgi:4-nitrophenyl phosphatase
MGIEGVITDQIVTSGTTTVDYLRTHYPAGSVVHVLGGDGLKAMITGAGFTLSEEARIVVVGIDFKLTYDKLRRATYLIRAGADFIGTNDDATYPMPEGLSPGTGSLLAALRAATDREPTLMGKPNQPMYDAALHVMGTERSATLMIGDRLNTDIQGAQAAGLLAALVLTGVATRESLISNPVVPDGVFDDLPALMAAWS